MNDSLLEDDETVNARLFVPASGYRSSEEVVTIKEDYVDANTQKDEKSGCSCTCTTCNDGNASTTDSASGKAQVSTAGGVLIITTPGQNGTSPVIYVGLSLPSNKTVPSTIEVHVQAIVPDKRADGSNKGLGRKPDPSNPSLSQSVTLEVDSAADPSKVLWFPIQLDFSAHMNSWTRSGGAPAGSSGITEQIVAFEVLAHPNFPATNPDSSPVVTADKFSGWVGHGNHAARDETASSVAPGLGKRVAVAGVERLLRNQTIMVSDVPSGGGSSGGNVKFETVSVLVRADGTTSWFANNAGTSPGTQDVLAGDYITDRSGAKRRFNANGDMIERIDPAGSVTSYTYNSDGSISAIEDPLGQKTTFTYFVDGSGHRNATISTVNSTGNPSLNRVRNIAWQPFSALVNGEFKVTYDDPDGVGGRAAREDVFTYDTTGQLTQIAVGEVGAPSHFTTISYNTASGSDGRVAAISYPDGSTMTLDLTRQQNSLISSTYNGGTIYTSDPRAFYVAGPGNSNPIPNYVVRTYQRSSGSDVQRTISQLDHRGRVLRSWDPQQVHALGLDTTSTWGTTQFQLLQSNIDLSYEYSREATERNDLGQITSEDLGEVLTFTSPDPDKIMLGGVLQTNGAQTRQVTTYTNTNNNPISRQRPLQNEEFWTWDDTHDVLTSATDATGNKYFQTVEPSTGLITQQRWGQPYPVWQNDVRPLDVNNDGVVTPIDALLTINYINTYGAGPVPGSATHTAPFLDVNGDGNVDPSDTALIFNYLDNPDPSNEVAPAPELLGQIDIQYSTNPALPEGLVSRETIKTGRASGDTTIDYEYYNTPSDHARHGKLKSVTEADGTSIEAVTQFEYDARGNLSKITDPAGRVTLQYHDNRDRLTAALSPDPDGSGPLLPTLMRYDYDVFDNVIATELVSSTLDGSQLLVTALTTSYVYDAGNRLTEQIAQNPDLKWYLYLNAGTLARTSTQATAVAGSDLTLAALTAYAEGNAQIVNAPVTNSSYQGLKTITSYFASPNVISTTTRDVTIGASSDRTVSLTYDRLDRVVKAVTPAPGSGLTTTASDQTESGGFVTTVSYDNLGNQISITDGLNNTTSMLYDNLNRITQITRPDPGTGTSPQTDFDYQANYFGWKITATDASGLELVMQTDGLGRTRSISGDTSTQEIRYWLDGLTKSTSEENGRLTQFDYDTRGRLLSVAAPAISGVSSTTNYAYLVDSLLDTVTDPAGRITSFSYDMGGRTQRITQPDPDGAGPLAAAYTDIVRDGLGNVLQSSDALGHATNTSYDAWFRPLTTTDPDGNVTSRGYDAFGNLLSVTDPLNNLTEYSYNKLGQLVSENKLDGTTNHLRSYSYDGVGNLRSMLDRNGRTTEFAYDNLYRATSETWKTGGTTNRTFSYSYDTSDRLTSLSDSDSLATDFQFVYDDRGQLQLERQLNGFVGTSVVLDRDFDAVGNRTKLEANFGGTLSGTSISGGVYDFSNSYAYDAMHRLTSVTQTSRSGANAVAPKLATFSYNAASQLTDVQRYSATTASTPTLEVHSRWGYDLAGRLTSITHGKTEITTGQTWNGSSTAPVSLGASNTLAAYFLEYDQANRLTDFSSYQDAFKTSYSFDNRDQLTAATSAAISGLTPPFTIPTAESYNLDDNGNRKSSGGASQSASGTHNRLQTDGTYNYTYDDEGNTTRRTVISSGEVTDFTWDHRNRLVSVTEKVSASGAVTQKVEFIYDAFDQRVGKRVDTDGDSDWDRYEAYVWADGHEVLRLVDSDGPGSAESFEVASRYLYADAVDQVLADEQYDGNGPVLSDSTASTQAGETLWTLGDHLGSIRDVVDSSGVIREHVVYDSFGNRLREVDYNPSGTQIAKSHADAIDILFGYTGRDWDEDIGLQYNRARWYDSATGRWLSQDPIGLAAGDANLYRYVRNDTTNAVDPSGLVKKRPAKKGDLSPNYQVDETGDTAR